VGNVVDGRQCTVMLEEEICPVIGKPQDGGRLV
jgi:hypothetical protein